MISSNINPPFTNIQERLLKVFAVQIPDAELNELKRVIAKLLLEKTRDRADKIWEEKDYTEETIQKLLSE